MESTFCHLLLFIAAFSAPLAECRAREAEVMAPGNPHMTPKANAAECASAGPCQCPAQQLSISGANAMPRLPVQSDTFMRVETKRAAGVEIDIYHFKQPGRLSELELPFKLLPLRAVELSDVVEMEVSPTQAMDSWFPGYAWSILVCTRCDGTHIGWKFTPTTAVGGQAFYALIVETVDKEEEDPLSTAARSAENLLASIRVAGRPLAALGIAASALNSAMNA